MVEIEGLDGVVTRDKLDIFVSSRLQECRAERTVARNAIQGINHNPILFEHIGARSMSPRTTYLSRLRDSQIMVAIYRLGYGYIDVQGGMTISGLEDELRYARDHGIPTLLYVLRDGTGREDRLTKMIDGSSSDLVISFYGEPQELENRIRDDVTAEITRFVLRPELARGVLENSPAELLNRAASRQGTLLDREPLIEELKRRSEQDPTLVVTGRAGIGKTTLTAQFAAMHGAKYIRVNGLTPFELFSVCAEALNGSEASKTPSTLQGAMLAFSSAWADVDNVVLVIDECDFPDELLRAVALGGDTSWAKRVILTSRDPLPAIPFLEIPEFSHSETEAIGARACASGSLLLFLGSKGGSQPVDAWLRSNATAVAQEALNYMALSPIPLAADDLIGLIGDGALGIERLYAELHSVSQLVDDSPVGFRLARDDTSQQLKNAVISTPQRLRFYVTRLEQHFEEASDFRSAYLVAELLGPQDAEKYSKSALRQSAMVGDNRTGRRIVESLLKDATDHDRGEDALDLMLMLIYPMDLMGDAVRASSLLQQAEALASLLGEEQIARVAEVKLASQARRTLSAADVEGLLETWESYAELGLTWDHARIGLELSALYISSKSFERAVEVLRPTLAEFHEIEDDYGVELAERNLAAALAGIPGNDAEVDDIIERITSRSSASIDPRRQRAWHNNILSRRYRTAGRLDDAERVTKETVELSLEIGEEQLAALNYINLGNVYRDKKEVAKALEAYDLAGRMAQRCARRDIEADGSRLRAGVLNDLEESKDVVANRFEEAKVFAVHAIGLLTDTIYHEGLARSYVELASAESEMGNDAASAVAYFEAASQFLLVPDSEGYDHAIIRAAELALDYDDGFYAEQMFKAFGLPPALDEALGDLFIELIEPMLRQAPQDFFTRMLGRHFQSLRSNLPPLLRPVLLEAVCDAIEALSTDSESAAETWRLLYPGFLLPFLSQDTRGLAVFNRFAAATTRSVTGLDVRYTQNDDCIWTVTLDLRKPVTISLLAMDDTPTTAAAIQCLAYFLKAFENEIGALIGNTEVHEVFLQVANFEEMPQDIREMSTQRFDLAGTLAKQSCAVSRTDDFSGETPTFVFLDRTFLEEATVGEGVGGSMQALFGLTLIEVIYRCFRGQVGHEEIRPKIVSLVRQTIS